MTPRLGPVVRATEIDGLVVIEARATTDERGTIRELFRASDLAHAGVEVGPFLQINLTETVPGAIRGLHSQYVYCFDAEWAPVMPGAAVNPLDPELGIRWPVQPDPSLVSVKDRSLPSLQTVLRRARAG